jgi:hypothetical protein
VIDPLKLTDKALLGKVSEPAGRNANEHRGSLVIPKNQRSSRLGFGEDSIDYRNLTDAVIYFGGVIVAACW